MGGDTTRRHVILWRQASEQTLWRGKRNAAIPRHIKLANAVTLGILRHKLLHKRPPTSAPSLASCLRRCFRGPSLRGISSGLGEHVLSTSNNVKWGSIPNSGKIDVISRQIAVELRGEHQWTHPLPWHCSRRSKDKRLCGAVPTTLDMVVSAEVADNRMFVTLSAIVLVAFPRMPETNASHVSASATLSTIADTFYDSPPPKPAQKCHDRNDHASPDVWFQDA